MHYQASAYVALGMFTEAIESFHHLLTLTPDNADAWYEAGSSPCQYQPAQ